MTGSTPLVHFDAATTSRLLDQVDLVDVFLQAFAAAEKPPLRQRIDMADGRELLVMPAFSDQFAGVKILTITPENASTQRPSIQGLFALFDLKTGTPLATIDADTLTGYRTAAVSAAAASKLANADATILTILGSGHLIPYLATAIATVRPIRHIKIWARNSKRGCEVVGHVRRKLPDIKVETAADLATAIIGSNIVCSATRATQPLIEGRWLSPGMHIDLVGGYRPDMREIDDAGIAKSKIYVDTIDGALTEAGDIITPLRENVITLDAILGDMSTIATSQVMLRDSQDITLFKSVGTAVADLVAATAAWERHCASQLA
jgi:ornithine cyclodeaminase/alanine dehydrogenase-like protein (mu-crystallin family)